MERNDEGANWVIFQRRYKQGLFYDGVKIRSHGAEGKMEDVLLSLVSVQSEKNGNISQCVCVVVVISH